MAYDKNLVNIQWKVQPRVVVEGEEGSDTSAIVASNAIAAGDKSGAGFTGQSIWGQHPAYQQEKNLWLSQRATYDGVKEIIHENLVGRHPREKQENWERRKKQLITFNYTKAVIETYCSHLTRNPAKISGDLMQDESFQMFLMDADYEGTTFEQMFNENAPFTSLYGAHFYIVDMPMINMDMSVEQARTRGVRPYVSSFAANAVLDWQYDRDEFGRPLLVYVKLLDNDGFIRCWWDLGDMRHWETYTTDISSHLRRNQGFTQDQYHQQKTNPDMARALQLVGMGDTDGVDRIPIVVHYNLESGERMIGMSDVRDIAPIDIQIVERLSEISEVCEMGAFPMLRMPMQKSGYGDQADSVSEVGPRSVFDFDPSDGEAGKPDWLNSPVLDPVNACLGVVDVYRQEIYRVASFGGMETLQSGQATGPAMKVRFQMLNSKLSQKSQYKQQAMNQIIDLWTQWMGIDTPDFSVEVDQDYNVEDLATDLKEAVEAADFVGTEMFAKELKKSIIMKSLPNKDQDMISDLQKEVDEQEEPEAIVPDQFNAAPEDPDNQSDDDDEAQ